MALLTKAQILQAQDLKTERLTVKEWGGDVQIQSLTGEKREKLDEVYQDYENNKGKIRATHISLSIIDENGEQVFAPEDIEALAKKNSSIIYGIYDRVLELNSASFEAAKKP